MKRRCERGCSDHARARRWCLLTTTGKRLDSHCFLPTSLLFSASQGSIWKIFLWNPATGKGIGKQLLLYLAKLAVERGYGRMNWAVLDWNQPAIDFYRSLGAVPQDDWTVYRLSGDALQRLANHAS